MSTTYRGREYTEVAVPLEALLQNGRLNLFDEVKNKNYFQVYSRGANLVFQCGGYIGLIPVNESISIEVAPRVKISNLDRILQKAGASHTIFPSLRRGYAASPEATYLTDLLADALIDAVEEIIEWGKHKEYTRRVHVGYPRSGKILAKQTSRLWAKNPASVAVVTARFERSTDNAFNACIRLAIERLIQVLAKTGDPAHRKRMSRLNTAWQSFSEVYVARDASSVAEEVERYAVSAHLSGPYLRALPLAAAVLRGVGPSQQNLPPIFSLGSLIFDVANAFEKYIRICLAEHCSVPVLDGNVAPPHGDKRPLFHQSTHPMARNVYMTPDIVIGKGAGVQCVLDVKYKPYRGMPDREDINQALTYAIAYGCHTCGLVYPASEAAGGVEDFGKVGNIQFYGFSMALDAQNLEVEEQRFARDVCVTLGLQAPAT